MPTVIANEIIGVQPMTGPVGQIHTLRVRYAEAKAGVSAGDEALSPFEIANAYSGDASAAPAATASLEGEPGSKKSIQDLNQTEVQNQITNILKKPFFEINISKEHKSFRKDYRLRENIGNGLFIS